MIQKRGVPLKAEFDVIREVREGLSEKVCLTWDLKDFIWGSGSDSVSIYYLSQVFMDCSLIDVKKVTDEEDVLQISPLERELLLFVINK